MFDAHNVRDPAEPAPSSYKQDVSSQAGSHTDVASRQAAGESVQQAYQSGDVGVDTGNMGSRNGAFLSHDQRTALVQQYYGRVEAAHSSYTTALTLIRLDTLVEKEEELSFAQSLLEAAVGKLMEAGLGMIVAGLKTSHDVVKKLAELGVEGVKETEVGEKVLGMSEKTIEGLIAGAADKVKEKAKAPIVKATGGEAKEHKKSQKLNYATYLANASMMMFQRVREKPPGTATDAQLIALVEAFNGDRHTISIYQEALEAQIGRYLNSHVKDIGRTEGKSPAASRAPEQIFRLENRVAWLQTGGGRQLIYVDRAFAEADDIAPNEDHDGHFTEPGAAYTTPEHALSLQDEGTWFAPYNNPGTSRPGVPYRPNMFGPGDDGSVRRHETPVGYEKMLGIVEPEFVELALRQQEEKWAAEPETFRYDYRTAPPTLIKVGK